METLPAPMAHLPIPLDSPDHPLAISANQLIVIVFAHSKSINLKSALNIAEQAAHLNQIDADGTVFYMAAFSRTARQAGLAIAILSLVSGWKGSHVFVGGRASHDMYKTQSVLDCFQKSMYCKDHAAHCHTVITEKSDQEYKPRKTGLFASLFGDKPEPDNQPKPIKWIHPCRMAASYYSSSLDPDHPSSFEDQLQAQVVRNECDWCPNLNIDNLRKL